MALVDVCWPTTCAAAGVDVGWYPCVDGNVANLDGCNENCEVEKGWECTWGDSTGTDTCWEVCGDSWNMG